MKLLDSLLLYGAIGFLMIGVHQSIFYGFAFSYWLFMITFILLGIYQHRKGKANQDKFENDGFGSPKKSNKKLRKKNKRK